MATATEVITKAIEEWVSENSAEDLRANTLELLDSARDEVVVKMAGFDNRWRQWEVRGRSNAVSNYIKTHATEAVNEWIATNVPNLPEMRQSLKDAFLEEYKHEYKRVLSSDLRDAARRAAQDDALGLVKEFTDQFGSPELVSVIEEDDEEEEEVESEWE